MCFFMSLMSLKSTLKGLTRTLPLQIVDYDAEVETKQTNNAQVIRATYSPASPCMATYLLALPPMTISK